MSTYLVDTDWCIDVLRDNDTVIQALLWLRPQGLAMSVITYAELYEGVLYGRRPDTAVQRFRALLVDFTVLGLSTDVAERFAVIRGALPRNQRQQVGGMDLLIAATAIEHDLTLLTNNVRDFTLIPGLRLYQSEGT